MRGECGMKAMVARMIALAAMFLAATGCGEQAAPAMLVETSGPVTVNGKPVNALPSAPLALAAGDALEVGAKGMARLLYPDGSRFMLLPHDAEPAALAVTPRVSSTGLVVIKLLKGALAFLVPEKRAVKDRYELKALNTVTTIEGTSGRVITGDKEDRVALEHGTVSVTGAAGAVTRISGLQQAVFDVASRLFKIESYDPTSPAETGYYEDGVSRKMLTH